MPEIPHFTRLACLPRDAFYEAGEMLPLLDEEGRPNRALIGRVCCDQVVPYPPGIPVLVPGQEIGVEVITYLTRLLSTQKHIELHGIEDDESGHYLRVLSEAELAALPQRPESATRSRRLA